MSLLIKCCRTNGLKTASNTFKYTRILSTQVQHIEVDDNSSIRTKYSKKHPQRPPFMKNVFLGSFDTDQLGFPEVLNNEEYKNLNDRLSRIEQSLKELDLSQVDASKKIPDDIRVQLRNLNLFSLQTPGDVAGDELNETENCRVLEVVSRSPSISMSIVNNQYLGAHVLDSKGSESLKKKYLSKLCSGENVSAFCLLEENCVDPMLMTTNAKLSEDGQSWILNGKKSFVINGSVGDVYIVLASMTEAKNKHKFNLFLVDKSFGGVTSRPCNNIGLKGADICHVTFDNTPVPLENVLSDGNDSLQVIAPLLFKLRLTTGPICISLLRELIDNFAKYALNNKHGAKYLTEYDFIRDKIAQLNINLYAIESLTYYTAGLLDRYEKQDCELESAIVKVFSSEKCLESVEFCMKLIGAPAYMNDHWLKPLFDDALGLVVMNETNESLRIITSLLGLQHAGAQMNEIIKKSRNPLYFPGFIIDKIFKQRRQDADNPKLKMGLEDYLHPSLTHSARWLEYCVYRMQYATESLLVRHGPQIVEQHMELKKLADVAMDIYTMVCVLSRASRSYCIGLQNADGEMLMANAFCLDARDRVKSNVAELARGPYNTNDVNYQYIAKRAFKFNGYFAEHALKKNF